jgi:hypothetical protein
LIIALLPVSRAANPPLPRASRFVGLGARVEIARLRRGSSTHSRKRGPPLITSIASRSNSYS